MKSLAHPLRATWARSSFEQALYVTCGQPEKSHVCEYAIIHIMEISPNGMPSGRLMKYGIPFMRIAFGLWFLYHEAYEKLHAWTPETLPKLFNMWAQNPQGYGFYKSFLLNFALPHASFFTNLVMSWEFVLGACLILGLGIRIVTPLQIFANINYILGKTYSSGGANLDRLAIIILVTLFLVSAGRDYGLDGWLRKKFPKLKWL